MCKISCLFRKLLLSLHRVKKKYCFILNITIMEKRFQQLNDLFNSFIKKENEFGDIYSLDYEVTLSKDVNDNEITLHSWFFTSKFHCFDFGDQKRFLNLSSISSIAPWIVVRKGEIAYEFTFFEH